MDKTAPKKKAATSKKAAKKTVVKKSATPKATPKKASVKKAAKAKKVIQTISYQLRYQKIAEAAFLLAEAQNFRANSELDNWLAAETQIDQWIKAEKLKLVD
jgi:hypothetical protein